jgi:hypothetical protein
MFAFRGKTLAAAHLSPGQSPASAERPKRRSHLEAISEKIFLRPICDLQIRNVAGRLDSRTSDPPARQAGSFKVDERVCGAHLRSVWERKSC